MIEIIFSIIALIVGYFLGRELLSIQTKQLKDSVEGLTEQVSFYQSKAENLEDELKKVSDELAKEKDIHQQVRKQIFAERDAGEKTINGLYDRINAYKAEIAELNKENQNLRYRSVPK